MTTIYNVLGTHPQAPNCRSSIAFSVEQARSQAIDFLSCLADDLDIDWGGKLPPADKWTAARYGLQAIHVAKRDGRAVGDVFAQYMVKRDDLKDDAGFHVWIEEHDVTIPSNIPGRLPERITLHTVAADTEMGTESDVFSNEDEAIDWLLGKVSKERDDLNAWMKENPDGPNEFYDCDIFGFLDAHSDHLDTFNIGARDVPTENLFCKLAIPDVAVILDGGLVQNVCSRDGQPVRVTIVDYDVEGADPNDLSSIPQDGLFDKPGDMADAYLSEGGFTHDTTAGEAFWQAVVGDPHAPPEFRTVFASFIELDDGDTRLSVFRTQAERTKDLIDFYSEFDEENFHQIGNQSSESQVAQAIEDRLGWKVHLKRTAMAEG